MVDVQRATIDELRGDRLIAVVNPATTRRYPIKYLPGCPPKLYTLPYLGNRRKKQFPK